MRSRIYNVLPCLVIAASAFPAVSASAADANVSTTAVVRSVAPSTSSRAYTLAAADELDIYVDNHPDLKETVTILPDGTIEFPQVGNIHAAGMTVDGLSNILARKLSNTLNNPSVTVVVHTMRARKFSVLGAVKQAGLYDASTDDHVLDAIAAAGGLAQDPSLTEITLLTDHGSSSESLNAASLMSGADPTQNKLLQPGDVVLVEARNMGSLQVQITGDVAKPGAYSIPGEGATVMSMLNRAGGPLASGALTQAQILHNGQVRVVNLKPATQDLADPVGNSLLMPGDVLQVPAITAKYAVLGAVKNNGSYDIPDGGAVTVSGALSAAGGMGSDADKNHTTLLHKTADGQVTTTQIDIDNLLRGKPGTVDPVLQSGDVLYVPDRSHNNSTGLIAPLAALVTVFKFL